MKNAHVKFLAFIFLIGYVLTACNGALPVGVEAKPGASDTAQVEFAGKVEAIDGDQWIVNGQAFTVDAKTQVGQPFKVGDNVQVSATVGGNGAVVANEVRAFDPVQKAQAQNQVISPTTTSVPEATATPQAVQAQTQTQTQSQTQAQVQSQSQPPADMQNPEFVGIVESVNGNQWTIGGQVFIVTTATQLKGTLNIGDLVKVQVTVNADGTFTIREMAMAVKGATPGWSAGSSSVSGGVNDNTNSSVSESGKGKNDKSSNDKNSNTNDDNHRDDNSNGSGDDYNDDNGGSDSGSGDG